MRISTTTLESFRRYMDPSDEYTTEEDLIDSIRGTLQPNPAMLLGGAFGRVLETPEKYRRFDLSTGEASYHCEGFTFPETAMIEALVLMDHERGVFEAKQIKRYGDCDVVAVVDQIVGARLYEHKATLGSFSPDKYLASCQWRFLLDAFDAQMLTYHVFLLSEERDDPSTLRLRGVETFNVFRYPDMTADCEALVRQFADYVRAKGLASVLERRMSIGGVL